jgi:integrase
MLTRGQAIMAKLTKETVDRIVADGRERMLWDDQLPGFGLRIQPSGVKTYLIQYRFAGRTRRLKIARDGVLSAKQARDRAKALLGDVARGIDPAARRDEERRDLTVAELIDLYITEGMTTKKPSTIANDKGKLNRHVRPLLGKRLVRSICRADIERLQADIANGKTAANIKGGYKSRSIVTGGCGTAARTLGLLSGVFQFAVGRKLRPDNPVRGVQRFADRKMERFLAPDELARLGTALDAMEADGLNGVAINLLRLLALTGCRRSELRTLRWEWVDFKWSCLRLPDSKTGAKVVLLGAAAMSLLASLQADRKDNPQVFPGTGREGCTTAEWKIWQEARNRARLPGVRIHDLRHSFASVGAGAGNSLLIIGALLGHKDPSTTARYAHLANRPLLDVADRIAENIAAALSGKSISQ